MDKATSTHSRFHLSEGMRNILIVAAIFGIIAVVSYFEWKNKLG